jgi:hypothetical protein
MPSLTPAALRLGRGARRRKIEVLDALLAALIFLTDNLQGGSRLSGHPEQMNSSENRSKKNKVDTDELFK